MRWRAIMILGPTASGKTALSLELAQSLPVEIISVDSALVYRSMDVGSAKPTKQERLICPHHLIDIREISETYSAAEFRTDALRLIEEIHGRNHFPLIVGGTMLYAKALREGIDELPSTDAVVREKVLADAALYGWSAMHEKLRRIDPLTAERLHPGDSQRIARALEVYEMTGKPLSELISGFRSVDSSIATYGLVPGDRAQLHRQIGLRYDTMIRNGLVAEVRGLMARSDFDRDLPAMRAVGYRQTIEYLLGECDLSKSVEKGKAATRQLAKRQMTWLRSMQEVTIVDSYEKDALKQLVIELRTKVERSM